MQKLEYSGSATNLTPFEMNSNVNNETISEPINLPDNIDAYHSECENSTSLPRLGFESHDQSDS